MGGLEAWSCWAITDGLASCGTGHPAPEEVSFLAAVLLLTLHSCVQPPTEGRVKAFPQTLQGSGVIELSSL